jgi:hypothetical protein
MLAKCANPSCSARFRYLAEGRLFRVECDPPLDVRTRTKPQYFWLCSQCSETMTLSLDQETVIRIAVLSADDAVIRNDVPFIPLERKQGLLLSSFRSLGGPTSNWHPRSQNIPAYAE